MGNTLFKISLTSVWALRLNCIFHFHERFLLQYRSWFLCKADSKTFNQKTKRNALVKLNTLSLQTDGWGWQTPFFSFLVRRNWFHTLYSFDTKTDFLPLCLLPSCMLVCISICNQCLSCLIELYSGFEELTLIYYCCFTVVVELVTYCRLGYSCFFNVTAECGSTVKTCRRL